MTKFKGGRPKSLTLFIPWKEYQRWNHLCLFAHTSTIYIICLFAWDESITPRIFGYLLQLIYNWTCLAGFLMNFSYGPPPRFNSSVCLTWAQLISPPQKHPSKTGTKHTLRNNTIKVINREPPRPFQRFQSFDYISLVPFTKFLIQ